MSTAQQQAEGLAAGLYAHQVEGVAFSHYLKNYRSQRHRLSLDLVKAVGDEAVVHLLTGTPLTSRLPFVENAFVAVRQVPA